jgi:cytochrome c oxidase subunit 3
MSFFGILTEKPWIPQAAGAATIQNEQHRYNMGKTALKFFLGVVSILFFLFTITFISRTQYPDFQALAGEPWQPLTNTLLLWVNTAMLLAASLALQWTKNRAISGQVNGLIVGLTAAVFFTVLFIIGQIYVWQQLTELGYFFNSNPANSYYYLFTSIHGLHIIGGIFSLSYVSLRYIKDGSIAKLSTGISLCTTYWHFLFLIWLLLFALLTSTSETFNTIALLCGF